MISEHHSLSDTAQRRSAEAQQRIMRFLMFLKVLNDLLLKGSEWAFRQLRCYVTPHTGALADDLLLNVFQHLSTIANDSRSCLFD
jgi:hypothetical protein